VIPIGVWVGGEPDDFRLYAFSLALPFGRRHLERISAEYISHYNCYRPHRALGQQAPLTSNPPPLIDDPKLAALRRDDALFGLIREYRMVA
jgi:transposase InsO family protein